MTPGFLTAYAAVMADLAEGSPMGVPKLGGDLLLFGGEMMKLNLEEHSDQFDMFHMLLNQMYDCFKEWGGVFDTAVKDMVELGHWMRQKRGWQPSMSKFFEMANWLRWYGEVQRLLHLLTEGWAVSSELLIAAGALLQSMPDNDEPITIRLSQRLGKALEETLLPALITIGTELQRAETPAAAREVGRRMLEELSTS